MSKKVLEQIHSRMAAIAAECGLTLLPEETDEWGDDRRELSYVVLDEDKGRTMLMLELAVPGMPDDLCLQNEGYTSGLLANCGLEELDVGGGDFDDAFWVAALEPEPALAWLTPERRQLLLALFFEKELSLSNGRVILNEVVGSPTLEAVQTAWQTLERTRDLLQNPPPLQSPALPRGINRRQRAAIYRPLLLLAALCGGGTLLVPGPSWQAGLSLCAAYFAATAAAWWRGQRKAYAMLKLSRWLFVLLAASLILWFVVWEYSRGRPVDAAVNGFVAAISLLLGHYYFDMKLTEASRIRLN